LTILQTINGRGFMALSHLLIGCTLALTILQTINGRGGTGIRVLNRICIRLLSRICIRLLSRISIRGLSMVPARAGGWGAEDRTIRDVGTRWANRPLWAI